MKRLVLDPNVLVSGIPRQEHARPPRRLVDAVEDGLFEMVACPLLLSEVRKALRKPYFRKQVDDSVQEEDRLLRLAGEPASKAMEAAATLSASTRNAAASFREMLEAMITFYSGEIPAEEAA